MPHNSNLKCHEGTTQQLSLWVHLCFYPHILYTLPPNKYCTCFTTFHLRGNSFLQSWRTRALVTDRWPSGEDLVLSPPWPSPNLWLGTQVPLQAIAGWGHRRSFQGGYLILFGVSVVVFFFFSFLLWGSFFFRGEHFLLVEVVLFSVFFL